MKISSVRHDNRKKAFEVSTCDKRYWFPFAKLHLRPTQTDQIASIRVDDELGHEAFTYELESGQEGTVHIDQVLDYNRDPHYMRDMLLYKLTLVAQERVKSSPLSKRELIRRLGTSPAQFYRLLDQTNYSKSIDRLMALLSVLDCEVDLVVKKTRRMREPAGIA
jgi:AraC-like DNA-binding protein